ncbi:hypothetical protein FYK55_17595 [Roseiconus nitratireducens]|uniref:Uncharacterized protein n=1 Tax=Roseiconus nitratireducens TaxID=2605748 RepID=A0A5M6D877_9BACT|nr:hypothetical protein [Roseiconus nitratireducens]KAA5541385.1 hypothetical protein FYK55_17595 [Roseiconus nitratireducens]
MPPSIRCDCGIRLAPLPRHTTLEIPVLCRQCDGRYVVDALAAGETLECECGASITVPDLVLAESEDPPLAEIEHKLPTREPDPVQASSPPSGLGVPEPNAPKITYAGTSLRIDGARIQFHTLRSASPQHEADPCPPPKVMFPIVEAPALFHLQLPPPRVLLPIVAAPELFHLQRPELDAKLGTGQPELSDRPEESSGSCDAASDVASQPSPRSPAERVSLPITAVPELIQLNFPSPPDLRRDEPLGSSDDHHPTEIAADPEITKEPIEQIRNVVLPITAPPILFSLQLPPADRQADVADQPTSTNADSPSTEATGPPAEPVPLRSESVFESDLLPHPPLVLDRTGERMDRQRNTPNRLDSPGTSKIKLWTEGNSQKPSHHRRVASAGAGAESTARRVAAAASTLAAGVLLFLVGHQATAFLTTTHPSELPAIESTAATPIPIGRTHPSADASDVVSDASPNPIRQAVHQRPSESVFAPDATSLADTVSASPELQAVRALAFELTQHETLNREQLHQFANAVEALGKQPAPFSVGDLFWLGETWEAFGRSAESADLAARCYWQSAAAYAFAQTVEEIPPGELALAKQRQNELSRMSKDSHRIATESANSGAVDSIHR